MTTQTQLRFSSSEFRRLTGAANIHVRLMESARVISPTKTATGWRQFSDTDVVAARRWIAENLRRRKQMG